MNPNRIRVRGPALAAGLFLVGGCVTVTTPPPADEPVTIGIPAIPRVDGPLEIRVVHPAPNAARPAVDSTFVFGSVGTGRARLRINDVPVEVEPNGAFLAYLPVPIDGAYQLVAEADGRTATASRAYRAPAPVAAVEPPPTQLPPPEEQEAPPAPTVSAAPTLVEFPQPRAGRVTGGADTLRTGSDAAVGRPSPGGTFRWFLPRGALLSVTGQQGDLLRVRLDSATTAWFRAGDVTLSEDSAPPPPATVRGRVRAAGAEAVEVEIEAGGAPFLVEPRERSLTVLVHGAAAGEWTAPEAQDGLIGAARWSRAGPDAMRLELELTRPLWGYQAFYEPDGRLVIRVRRPPPLDRGDPLEGARIVIDPGHPPAGAIGPTGLTEAEANLAIALRLAEKLRDRGAEVILTRIGGQPLASASDVSTELRARTRMAVDADAHLMVSVHNNAFAEGVNPFRNHGTSTYFFHPFAEGLARALNEEILGVTRLANLGVRQGNLAVVRPTWMPTALTESLFMMIPAQEAALRHPGFLDRLATAHLRGIERFLRERL